MRVVAEGNANFLIDYGDTDWLYRCCKRFPQSLKECNEYTRKNFEFITTTIRPILGDLLCPYKTIPLPVSILEDLEKKYYQNIDDSEILVLKVKNLKPDIYSIQCYDDHFTSFYSNIERTRYLLELKPKWLYNSTKDCRNCTHNLLKKRYIPYCYNLLLQDHHHIQKITSNAEYLSKKYQIALEGYFARDDNILKLLYSLQSKFNTDTLVSIVSSKDISEEIILSMILRDVSCFIEWNAIKENTFEVYIVDVDLKPKEKWKHWRQTLLDMEQLPYKVSHEK